MFVGCLFTSLHTVHPDTAREFLKGNISLQDTTCFLCSHAWPASWAKSYHNQKGWWSCWSNTKYRGPLALDGSGTRDGQVDRGLRRLIEIPCMYCYNYSALHYLHTRNSWKLVESSNKWEFSCTTDAIFAPYFCSHTQALTPSHTLWKKKKQTSQFYLYIWHP